MTDYAFASQAMQLFGDDFIKRLGIAWVYADPISRKKLEEAFRIEFEWYALHPAEYHA